MLGMSMKECRSFPTASGTNFLRAPQQLTIAARQSPGRRSHREDNMRLGKSKRAALSSEKRTARAGAPADRSGSRVLHTRLDLMGGVTPEVKDMTYLPLPIKYRSVPRNAPSRSKIEALRLAGTLTPTAPGSHMKGDNYAARGNAIPME